MPAAKLFLSSDDISAITGVSLRRAQEILCMFDMRGQVIRNGRRRLVDVNNFCCYLSDQDGIDVEARKKDVMNVLREMKKERGKQ